MSNDTIRNSGPLGIVDSYRALQRQSQPATTPDPEKNRTIGLQVTALASHFYDKDVSPEQTALKTLDFIHDLAEFTTTEIQSAFTNYRQDGNRKRFPTPGEIRELCFKERADRKSATRPAVISSGRPAMWWHKPKNQWRLYGAWHESEVPRGELIRDEPGGPFREPQR